MPRVSLLKCYSLKRNVGVTGVCYNFIWLLFYSYTAFSRFLLAMYYSWFRCEPVYTSVSCRRCSLILARLPNVCKNPLPLQWIVTVLPYFVLYASYLDSNVKCIVDSVAGREGGGGEVAISPSQSTTTRFRHAARRGAKGTERASREEGETKTWGDSRWEGKDGREDVCENVVNAGEYTRGIFPFRMVLVRLKLCK